jgi:glycosyltransferase involved in cell wall biosynthesis
MIENNGELKRRLEEGAKNSYSEKYSPEVVLKKYMEVYESLIQ